MKDISDILVVRRAESSGDILVNICNDIAGRSRSYQTSRCIIRITISGKIIGILHTTNDSLADVVQADKIDIFIWTGLFL